MVYFRSLIVNLMRHTKNDSLGKNQVQDQCELIADHVFDLDNVFDIYEVVNLSQQKYNSPGAVMISFDDGR